jgi:hypothetical protein
MYLWVMYDWQNKQRVDSFSKLSHVYKYRYNVFTSVAAHFSNVCRYCTMLVLSLLSDCELVNFRVCMQINSSNNNIANSYSSQYSNELTWRHFERNCCVCSGGKNWAFHIFECVCESINRENFCALNIL